MEPEQRFMDIKQLASHLDVCYATASRLVREGRVPGAIRLSSGPKARVRIDVRAFNEAGGLKDTVAA